MQAHKSPLPRAVLLLSGRKSSLGNMEKSSDKEKAQLSYADRLMQNSAVRETVSQWGTSAVVDVWPYSHPHAIASRSTY